MNFETNREGNGKVKSYTGFLRIFIAGIPNFARTAGIFIILACVMVIKLLLIQYTFRAYKKYFNINTI